MLVWLYCKQQTTIQTFVQYLLLDRISLHIGPNYDNLHYSNLFSFFNVSEDSCLFHFGGFDYFLYCIFSPRPRILSIYTFLSVERSTFTCRQHRMRATTERRTPKESEVLEQVRTHRRDHVTHLVVGHSVARLNKFNDWKCRDGRKGSFSES